MVISTSKTATFSTRTSMKLLDIHKELVYIEKHLHKALNMVLAGECKAQGAAILECALADVMNLKDKLKADDEHTE